MKKRIIISIILVVLLVIALLLPTFFSGDKNIVKALNLYGFQPLDGNKFFTKQVSETNYDDYMNSGSEYNLLSFNFDSYMLSNTYMENSNGVDFTYNGNYLFNTNIVDFNVHYVYEGTNVILLGTYEVDSKDFVCEPEVTYDADLTDQKETLCSEVKTFSEDFAKLTNNIFNKEELNYLKQKTKD